MNAEQLNPIKERAEKATPGPWEVCDGTDVFTALGAENKDGVSANSNDGWYIAKANEGTTSVGDDEISLSYTEQNSNAHFIAKSREDIPALIAEIERLTESDASKEVSSIRYYNELQDAKDEIERLRGALTKITKHRVNHFSTHARMVESMFDTAKDALE